MAAKSDPPPQMTMLPHSTYHRCLSIAHNTVCRDTLSPSCEFSSKVVVSDNTVNDVSAPFLEKTVTHAWIMAFLISGGGDPAVTPTFIRILKLSREEGHMMSAARRPTDQ